MTASSRGGRALQGVFSAAAPRVCARCALGQHARAWSRPYAAAAAEAPTGINAVPPLGPAPGPASHAPPPPPPYDVRSGLILTRAPLLTRRLHPFENAFFFYQKRLEERLSTAFITSIYFKPATARQMDWDLKVRERKGSVAKELGVYYGKGSRAWADELRVGDELSSQDGLLSSLLRDAEARVSDDAEVIAPDKVVPAERPMARETDADRQGDVRRLDRKLDRTLYLVVKGEHGWGFPADVVLKDETLHETAQRVLDQAAGVNMNTWIVGRVPVAHLVANSVVDADGTVRQKGQKTFFLKGRIMAGQADIKENPFGYTDFKWLTREELETELASEYYHGVRNSMAAR